MDGYSRQRPSRGDDPPATGSAFTKCKRAGAIAGTGIVSWMRTTGPVPLPPVRTTLIADMHTTSISPKFIIVCCLRVCVLTFSERQSELDCSSSSSACALASASARASRAFSRSAASSALIIARTSAYFGTGRPSCACCSFNCLRSSRNRSQRGGESSSQSRSPLSPKGSHEIRCGQFFNSNSPAFSWPFRSLPRSRPRITRSASARTSSCRPWQASS